jgi:RNA polymerase sigma-70 factor (ECF subfamily)
MEELAGPAGRIENLMGGCAATEEAFAALTRQNLDGAYRLAWAILRDSAEADDATQDAFAIAWRKRSSLREPDRFEAWFGRFLVNVCRERLRSRSRGRVRSLEAVPVPTIDDSASSVSNRDEIGRALDRLDVDHRIVVILRYWADLPVDEIGARLGIPAGTVKSRLHNALRSMRLRLEDPR